MSTDVDQTLAMFQAKLDAIEKEAAKVRSAMNLTCEIHGRPPMFAEEDFDRRRDSVGLSIRSDQFYGQPLAAAIRTILEMRKKLNAGAATVNEIYSALVEGGFAFDTKNEENAKRNLRISLSKNTATFHKLPNGKFGLLEWYPSVRPARRRIAEDDGAVAASGDESDEEAA